MRIDPNTKVGDTVTVDGVAYTVGLVEDHGPNTRRQTEYVKILGLRRPRGRKFYAVSITEDGRCGRIVDVGY